MKNPPHRLILITLVLLAGSLSAQPDVQLRGGRGPFLQFVRLHQWTQWTFTLVNNSDQPRTLQPTCLTGTPGQGPTRFARRLSVPPKTMRHTQLAYRPGTLSVMKEDPKAHRTTLAQPYRLIDPESGQQLQASTDQVIAVGDRKRMVAFIQNDPIEHDTRSYLGKADGPLGDIQATSLSTEFLPDQWYGYEMIDLVCLSGLDRQGLSDTRRGALLDWVARGGVLLLGGHPNLPELLDGPMGQAAGVTATGAIQRSDLPLRGPDDFKETLNLSWPLPVVTLLADSAEVIYTIDGLAFITRRRFGQGHIITFAAPLGAMQPTKTFRPFDVVDEGLRSVPPIDTAPFLSAGQKTLSQIAGRQGPSRLIPALILLSLAAFVLLAGAFLRLWRQGEIVWIVLVPVALLAAGGLYYIGRLQVDPERISHIGLVSGLTDGRADIRELFAYASGPQSRQVTFQSGSPAGLASPLGSDATARMTTTDIVTTADGTALPDITLAPDDTTGLTGVAVESVGQIAGELTFDEQGAIGTLRNTLPGALSDGVLYINRMTYRLPDLPAGRATPVRISDAQRLGAVEARREYTRTATPARPAGRGNGKKPSRSTTSEMVVTGEFSSAVVPNQLRNDLMRQLVSQPDFRTRPRTDPVLIGYTDAMVLDPLPGRNLPRQGWSAVVWPIRLAAPPAGTAVTIPTGFVQRELINRKSPIWNVHQQVFHETVRPSTILVKLAPPACIARLAEASAELEITIRANGYRMIVSGVRVDADDEITSRRPLKTLTTLAGRIRIELDGLDDFRDPQGRFAILLDVQRAGEDLLGQAAPTGTLPWKFERIAATLKGTVR